MPYYENDALFFLPFIVLLVTSQGSIPSCTPNLNLVRIAGVSRDPRELKRDFTIFLGVNKSSF